MRTRLLAALLVLTAAPAAAATRQTAREILPGSPLVDGSRLRPATVQRKLVRTANGTEQVLGSVLHTIKAIQVRGQPALMSITTITTPRGSGADTAVFFAQGLVPISHGSLNPGRAMSLVFDGRNVSGSITPSGGAPSAIQHETAVPTFDSAIMDLVVAALPLETGFAARLPLYIHEQNALVWLEIRVNGETEIPDGDQSVPVFDVSAQTPIGSTRFFIHRTHREIVRTTFKTPDGAEMRIAR